MTKYEKEQRVAYIFESQRHFEQEVLMIENEHQRYDVLGIIARYLVFTRLRDKLHFNVIKERKCIDTECIENAISYMLFEELLTYLTDEMNFTKVEAKLVIQEKETILFVSALSSFYYKRYHNIILGVSVDTLFEKIGSTVEPTKFLHLCVEGSTTTATLFQFTGGSKIFYSYAQAHKKMYSTMQIKRAKIQSLQRKLAGIMQQSSTMNSEQIQVKYEQVKKELEELQNRPLELFDENLKRVKKSVITALYTMQC